MKMRFRILVVMTLLLPLLPIGANAQFYRLKQFDKGIDLTIMLKADLNNDGKPDVVGMNSSSSVAAALGDGKGGFSAFKTTPITGLKNPSKFTFIVGDFNGDGFPDVVVSGSDPVTGLPAIGVMLGNGDGTFQATTVYISKGSASFASGAAGDFTGHGKIDVAIQAQNSISVFPGKGDGTFGAPIFTDTGVLSGCTAAADFNGDGKLDLTTGKDVLLGKGNGTFQEPIPVPDGNCDVAVADLNHDGIPDLVTGTLNFTQVRVHLGNGTGKFDTGTPYQTGNTAGSGIQVADLNGDGSPDLAVLNGGDSDVTVLLNKGDGTFNVSKTWFSGPDDCCSFLLVGDYNQDNNKTLDLVVRPTGGPLGVILGNGDGTFQIELAQSDQLFGENRLATHIGADVNNDHKQDLVFSGEVSLGNGNGSFQEAIPYPKGCQATTVGDFNNDGRLDIAGPPPNGSNSVGVIVCLGNGDGTFRNPAVYDQGVQHNFVLAGDFNNDGNLDLAASDQGGISILLGNGKGSFQSGTATPLDATFPTFVLGDFNNDGKLDVAAITPTTVSVLLGKGNGKFFATVTNSISATEIAAADLNHDGKLDLVALDRNNGTVSVWLGNGDGTFTKSASTAVGDPANAVIDDFELDGNLDIALSSPPAYVIVLAGDGKGGFKSHTTYLSGNGTCCLVNGDFNGDKRPDLVVPGDGGLIVFLNILK
jgi:hypothetical protein